MKKWMVLSLLFVPAAAADINPDQAGVAEEDEGLPVHHQVAQNRPEGARESSYGDVLA